MNDSILFILGLLIVGAVVQFAIAMRRTRRNGSDGVRDYLRATRRAGRIVVMTMTVALLIFAFVTLVVARLGH
jgi:phosphatidylglycerophosphate synthase